MSPELRLRLAELQHAIGSHYSASFVHERAAVIEWEVNQLLTELELAREAHRSVLGSEAKVRERVRLLERGNDEFLERIAELAASNRGLLDRNLQLEKDFEELEVLSTDHAHRAHELCLENERLSDEVEYLKLQVQIEKGKSQACMDMVREMAGASVRLIAMRTPPDFHIEKEMD